LLRKTESFIILCAVPHGVSGNIINYSLCRSTEYLIIIIIMIIIAPLSILSEEEGGDLECLYEVCQAAITDGVNEQQSEITVI